MKENKTENKNTNKDNKSLNNYKEKKSENIIQKKSTIKKEKLEKSEDNSLIIERAYDNTKSDFKSKYKIIINFFK